MPLATALLTSLALISCSPEDIKGSTNEGDGVGRDTGDEVAGDTDPAPGGDSSAPPVDSEPPDSDSEDTGEPPLPAPEVDPDLILQYAGDRVPGNVLMISIDTLRRDYIGRYDPSGVSVTPNIDRLLGEGVALDNHRSCSNWTYQSVLCVLTGKYGVENGYIPISGDDLLTDLRPLPDTTQVLPDMLREFGFTSGLIATNPFLSADFGFDGHYDTIRQDPTWRAESVSDQGLALFDELLDGEDHWLLHLHYLDPHSAYDAPEEYLTDPDTAPVFGLDMTDQSGIHEAQALWYTLPPDGQEQLKRHVEAVYRAEVAYTDTEIGRLLDGMEARGALDDTLVVIWADHGEQLFDRGYLEHHDRLHNEESTVIAGFWARDLLGGTFSLETGHTDLTPTVVAGLGLPVNPTLSGRALKTDLVAAPTFSSVLRGEFTSQSVDYRNKRLIYNWQGWLEFFDLELDEAERAPGYNPEDEDVRELWTMLKSEVDRVDGYYVGFEPETPDVDIIVP
jgi:arylsulfatase A-like enzyme